MGSSISRLMAGASVMVLAASPGIAANEASESLQTLEEIVVTASKRPATLQDTPIAVSVVGADTVEKARIVDLIDLQASVPSLRVTQLQTSSQTNFEIRGFGNGANNTGIENSVGVFIDGVYRSRSPAAIVDLPVIERVEVLRGPQSTLFGKNVSAGAISIVTKGPEDEFAGSVEATYGNYDQIGLRGTVTGPLSETLAFRLSASYNKRDGYYDNVVLGTDINNRNRYSVRGQLQFEPSDTMSFRLIADYNRIDEVCCGALQIHNGPATQLVALPPSLGGLGAVIGDDTNIYAREAAADVNPENELVGKGVSLQADFDFGFAGLTSITAYREQSDSSNSEVDFTGADIAYIPAARDFKTFTQELRLTSHGADNKVEWMIGAFLFDEAINTGRSVTFGEDALPFIDALAGGGLTSVQSALGLPPVTFYAPGTGIDDFYEMDNVSFSVNAQFDIHLTDRLTLTAGAAYMKDRKEAASFVTLTEPFSNIDLVSLGNSFLFQGAFAATYAGFGVDATDPTQIAAFEAVAPGTLAAVTAGAQAFADANDEDPTVNPVLPLAPVQFFEVPVNYPNANETGILKDDKITYSAKLAYDLTEDMNVYASYSTGWKAGAYNLSSDSRPPNAQGLGRTADPEDVSVFEIGLKASMPRGNLYVALFDQTIKGFQSNIFNGTGFSLANAGKQSVKGFEIETTFSPVDPLMLTAALTYLDPKYDSFVSAACADYDVERCGNGELTRDLSGERPSGIHEVSLMLSATYTHDFSAGLSGYLRAEYAYESDTQVADNVPRSVASRETNVVNLGAGLDWENGISVMAYVRNLTNDNYLLSAFPTVIQAGSFSGYANAPRTFGVSVKKRF